MSKTNNINKQLRKDLMDTYRRVAPECWLQHHAWEAVVRSEAPRYYVTPKQAYQVLLPVIRGDWSGLEKMSERRQRMYTSLYEKVIELSQKRQYAGQSLWFLIHFAVTSKAPEFFVSERWMRQIFMEENRGYRYKPVFKKKCCETKSECV